MQIPYDQKELSLGTKGYSINYCQVEGKKLKFIYVKKVVGYV